MKKTYSWFDVKLKKLFSEKQHEAILKIRITFEGKAQASEKMFFAET